VTGATRRDHPRGAVVVESARGELVGVARVDTAIRRGAVSVPHGHQGANVNRLSDSHDIDRTTGMAHDSGVAVTLRPVTSRTRAARQRSRKEREA